MTTYKEIGTGAEKIFTAAQKASKGDVEVGLEMLMIATCILAHVQGVTLEELQQGFVRAWEDVFSNHSDMLQ